MLNYKDILQTRDMIDKRHLDIRTITMGISLLDCADPDVNVLDISQTVMQGYFTMMMVVDVSGSTCPLAELAQKLEEKGKEMNLSIRLQREDIFEAMHRV